MAELQIPITKGKGFLTINTDDVEKGGDMTAEVYREALIQGLKVILNRGMSKITKESFENEGGEEAMKAAAMKTAEKTLGAMRTNSIRFTGEKKASGKVAGEVMTEARRIARNYVKEGLKAEGEKIAHYPAKEITRAANEMIAENPEIVEEAKRIVEARKAETIGTGKIDLKRFAKSINKDPKLVAAAEKEKAERKAASSATKAGKVAVRAKPKAGGAQHTAH